MKFSIIIIFCILLSACSLHSLEVAMPPDSSWTVMLEISSLDVELSILGYGVDCVKATIDEFYRLNPRYFKKTNYADAYNVNYVTTGPGWRLMQSPVSGIVYKYSFKKGDILMLPIKSLKDHSAHAHKPRSSN